MQPKLYVFARDNDGHVVKVCETDNRGLIESVVDAVHAPAILNGADADHRRALELINA